MPDPFATALAALHSAAGSVAAIYTPAGGAPAPIRVIWSQGSADVGSGRRTVVDGNTFDIRRADIAVPARGDIVAIGAERFKLNGAPMLDTEGLTWTCPAQPA